MLFRSVEYLSEPALNRERMRVEVEWMILLANGFEGNGNQTIVPGVKPLTDEVSIIQISWMQICLRISQIWMQWTL